MLLLISLKSTFCSSLSYRQSILNKGHFHILAFFVIATDLKNEAANMIGDFLFGNVFHDLRHFHF